MILEAGAVLAAGCLGMGWAVRGKSSQLLGPTLWRGPKSEKAMALTFDDGPSEATPELLELLDQHRVPATFFFCGMHVRRLPAVAAAVRDAGHEIGNHTENHAALWLRTADYIAGEVEAAQQTMETLVGVRARLFRPPYGVRWFGLTGVERRLGLTRVMWSCASRDWVLDASGVEQRLKKGARAGAIHLLHDGRERAVRPDIASTTGALRRLLPRWLDEGYRFLRVSELCRIQPISATTSNGA